MSNHAVQRLHLGNAVVPRDPKTAVPMPHGLRSFVESCGLTTVAPVGSVDRAEVARLRDPSHIVLIPKLNDARYINKLLEAVNKTLPTDGYIIGRAETNEQRWRRLRTKYPTWLADLYYCAIDFPLKRVVPKVPFTKSLYFALTRGRNRALSKAEVLGRVVSCGFEIVQTREQDGLFYFAAKKVEEPAFDNNPSYGPLFRMRRVGECGKPIEVFKLRTMHPFAEYLQEYVHKHNQLQDNGKFREDFRITGWGRFCRKIWLDELPMIINFFKRELKLVGVRPLSKHYLSLYPKDLARRRTQVRPGLIPPYYADLPRGFDEILASEARYLESYEKHPIRTDLKYLFRALYNIFVKRARSQ